MLLISRPTRSRTAASRSPILLPPLKSTWFKWFSAFPRNLNIYLLFHRDVDPKRLKLKRTWQPMISGPCKNLPDVTGGYVVARNFFYASSNIWSVYCYKKLVITSKLPKTMKLSNKNKNNDPILEHWIAFDLHMKFFYFKIS